MKRRNALKGMGTVFGFVVATPTLLGLLEGCQRKPYADWVPRFFGESEGRLMARMLDVLLPETDTPSATALGVYEFIDGLFSEALPAVEKDLAEYLTRLSMTSILAFTGKETADEVGEDEIAAVFSTYLKKRAPEVEEAHQKAIMEYALAVEQGEAAELDPELATFVWMNQFRDLAINAYRETEEIGENVLAYKPVPGEYIPCGDLQELTGGRAWSIGS